MQHLFLPFGVKRSELVYNGRADYIGVSFLDYPRQVGCPFFLEAIGGPQAAFKYVQEIEANDNVSFLETWLFCSLLQEFFGFSLVEIGLSSLYRHDDFVRLISQEHPLSTDLLNGFWKREVSTRIFYTGKLLPLIEEWKDLVQTRTGSCGQQYANLITCLNITNGVLSWPFVSLHPGAKTIICTVAELLSLAIAQVFEEESFRGKAGLENPAFGARLWDQGSMDMLVKHDWCPTDAATLEHFFPDAQSIQFLKHVQRRASEGFYKLCPSHKHNQEHGHPQHHYCTVEQCSNSREHPQDRQPGCLCQVLTIKTDHWSRLCSIIENNGVPLLELNAISSSNAINSVEYSKSISIVECTPQSKYVAISHVCADGLGNSAANEMLACRFDYLVRAVTDHWPRSGSKKPDRVLIWIDTICCPVDRALNDQVLSQMTRIYSSAERVLVLDSELENTPTIGMGELEIISRILTSRWTNRLWTLQESFLAKQVWFRLQDNDVNIARTNLQHLESFGLNQYYIAITLKRLYVSIRFRDDDFGGVLRTSILNTVATRQVTQSADEALCLGTLLGFDVGKIIEAGIDNRMRTFWELMAKSKHGIPQGIIFHSGNKLTTPGYRWAPSSLLQGISGFIEPLFLLMHSKMAALDVRGLQLQSAGFRLQSNGIPFAQVKDQLKAAMGSQGAYYMKDQQDRWFVISYRKATDHVSPSDFRKYHQNNSGADQKNKFNKYSANITEQRSTTDPFSPQKHLTDIMQTEDSRYGIIFSDNTGSIGLLVEIEIDDGEFLHVRGLQQVNCYPASNTKILVAAEREALKLKQEDLLFMASPHDENALRKSRPWIAAEEAFRRDPEYYQNLGYVGPHSVSGMAGMIIYMLANLHHIRGTFLADTQKWCIT